jgi:hypothetical protein
LQLPEFLKYQRQVRHFEGVIGGTSDDVVWSSGEGTEHFDGGLVSVKMVPSRGWRRGAAR